MVIDWTRSWKSSIQPRKQRKYIYNAPLHVIRKFFSATLSKELRQKYSKRNVSLRTGDRVKVLRGQFKGKLAKVEKISFVRGKLYLEGVGIVKKDGNKVPYPVHASNVMVVDLNLEDSKRKKSIERK